MSNDLSFSFRIFGSRETAEMVAAKLQEVEVLSLIKEDTGDLTKEFLGESPSFKYELYIREEDRGRATDLMKRMAMAELNDIDPEHFLFSYSNGELMQILVEKDEWSEIDVLLSEKILNDRGVTINESELNRKREEHFKKLAEPEKKQFGWIIFGYICLVLLPLVGAVLGFAYWKSQKRLPSGVKVKRYSPEIQGHGRNIAIFSLISLAIQLYLNVGLPFYIFEF